MAKTKTARDSGTVKSRRPARTPEARENQMISDAYDLAEKRLKEGTASASEVVHFLKLGSQKEKLAMEREIEEIKLLKAKTEALESQKQTEELYREALSAMKTYSGANLVDVPT